MNYWIIIIAVILIILIITGFRLKKLLYTRQSDWCPKIGNLDEKSKNKFEFLMRNVIQLKELWFSKIFISPKKKIFFIILILVGIGYLITTINSWNIQFLNDILSFYPAFMDMLGILFAGITYLFSMIIGIFVYGDVNYLIHDEECSFADKSLNVFFTFLNYLLSYILPLIIIVSLISSSANTATNESSDDLLSSINDQINPNITSFLIFIVFILLVAVYIIFSHLQCGELGIYTLKKSFIYTLLVLFLVIVGNILLVYFTIQNYTKLLINTHPNIGHWILLAFSILIYYILTIRGVNSKNLIENFFNNILKGIFDKCSNSKTVTFGMGEFRDKERAEKFNMSKEDFKKYRKEQIKGDVFGISPSKFGKTMLKGLKPDIKDIKKKNKDRTERLLARTAHATNSYMAGNKSAQKFIGNLKNLPNINR